MITPILVAPYRQMPRFSGCSDKAGVPSVQEWVMDMGRYLSAKRSSKAEKAACVVGHLTGKARQEIVVRGESVTSSAEEIFQALVRVFGDGFTLPQLQQRFFSYPARESDLLSTSLELVEMYDRIAGILTNRTLRVEKRPSRVD